MSEEQNQPKKENDSDQLSKLKQMLRVALTEDAYNRMINISLANQEMFLMAAQNVLVIYKRSGRKINDDELLSILRVLKSRTQRETRITFHKK